MAVRAKEEKTDLYYRASFTKNKVLAIVLAIGVVLAIFFVLYQYLKYSQYSQYQIDESKITDSSLFIWGIDAVDSKYDVLKVSGWMAYRGESISTWDLSMVIQNDDNCYVVPMALQNRTDITEAMNDGFNYDNSGFVVTINKRYIQSGSAHYYILYKNNEKEMIVDIDGAIGGE